MCNACSWRMGRLNRQSFYRWTNVCLNDNFYKCVLIYLPTHAHLFLSLHIKGCICLRACHVWVCPCVQDYNMFPRYLQYPSIDFHQAFVIGASWDKDDLIGFWGPWSRSHYWALLFCFLNNNNTTELTVWCGACLHKGLYQNGPWTKTAHAKGKIGP